uniref:Sorbitol dehydrogenase n=1 Tax=Encarsia formosa TaxID=32400 RepID=A0A481SZ29_ENCFO|nr:alcohol dehydrogenase [Encarsia formosa]
MAKDNLTAVLHGIHDLRLEQTEIEEPGDGEVLIKMGCVGICGSDIHYLVHGKIGDFVVTKPMIIGHEASGTICKIGKKVKNLKVGDRVAIEPGTPCRLCDFCKKGNYNLCEDMVFCATPPYDGNLRRYYKHAADFCFKLPDHMSLEEGALLEPLSVGVHACKRGNIGIGSNVLILGAGPIGLVTLLAAKAMGAQTVIVTDLRQDRLDHAKKLGADKTLCLDPKSTEKENVEKIHKLADTKPDVTIDACGFESSVRLAIYATKTGGTAVIVGMGMPDEIKVPLMNALCREIDIRGVFRYVNDYSDALELVSKKGINVKSIITHRYKLEETLQAFETSRTNKDAIKVMITCD